MGCGYSGIQVFRGAGALSPIPEYLNTRTYRPSSHAHLPVPRGGGEHGAGVCTGMNRFYEDLIRQMEQEFERSDEILRRFLHSVTSPERFWEPEADVYETREAVKVKVELAGVRPEAIQVELSEDGRALHIRGV